MDTQTPLQTITFHGPIMLHHTRGTAWYIGAALCFGLMVLFCIMAKAWSFLVILALGAGFYGWLLFKPTPHKTLRISSDGIELNNTFYPYKECTEFWVLDHGHDQELHIGLRQSLKHDIRIFLGDTDTDAVRKLLSTYIKENGERHERLVDIIIRLLKI
jgi:hypothetical protein